VKSLLASRPVLWFLFLFNAAAVVAAVAPFVVEGAQGVMTAVENWVGAGCALHVGWTGPNRGHASLESSQQEPPAQELR